jgi:putative ABC transport system substrate-binding protein
MNRRELLVAVGSAAAVWPPMAHAQRSGRLPTVGVLGTGTASGWQHYTAAFEARLRELSWQSGHTIAIQYLWAEGRSERFAEIAAEFARRKVDVIVTGGGAVTAAKQATSTIPIVFALANDPVATGLVASLARPGSNVTGLSQQAPDLAAKRIELLREFISGIRRISVLGNAGYSAARLEMREVSDEARKQRIEAVPAEIRRAEDIAPAFAAMSGKAQALYVVADPLTGSNQAVINALATRAKLATMHGIREYVESGGFLSYGADIASLFRRSADYVDRILRGAAPASLPVEQPTTFELVVNLKTAKVLGLAVAQAALERADLVIE